MSAKAPGDPGPQGNRARRHSRHGSGQGHSDLARRHDQPRGRGRARHGHVPASPAPSGIAVNEHKKEVTVTVERQDRHREGRRLASRSTAPPAKSSPARPTPSKPIPPRGVLGKFMGWADEFRGKFGVRANADIPRDAKVARQFGAEGIGLCRTEHMFFAEDRIAAHAGHDSGARRKDRAARRCRSCCPCSARISPACSKPWTASRW